MPKSPRTRRSMSATCAKKVGRHETSPCWGRLAKTKPQHKIQKAARGWHYNSDNIIVRHQTTPSRQGHKNVLKDRMNDTNECDADFGEKPFCYLVGLAGLSDLAEIATICARESDVEIGTVKDPQSLSLSLSLLSGSPFDHPCMHSKTTCGAKTNRQGNLPIRRAQSRSDVRRHRPWSAASRGPRRNQ